MKSNLSLITLFLGLILFQFNALSQSKREGIYQPILSKNFIQSKNYYFLTLVESMSEVRKFVIQDSVLKKITSQQRDALQYGLETCKRNLYCYTQPLQFSDSQITAIGSRLVQLYSHENALGKLVRDHLIPSHAYILHEDLSADQFLRKAWEQDARGINFVIGVYAEGKKPNYPAIDSISFQVMDSKNPDSFNNGYLSLVYNAISVVLQETKKESIFFNLSLTAAQTFLEINEREQAADFEPMEATENLLAVKKIATTQWDKFPYSVILIPGAGPDDPKQALSPEGMLRCKLAALEYQKGMAPFIMTSGGRVHPYKTNFCEATEMKKYLIEKLKVPATAIIIEPHARHTTTNMRNAARLIYKYGMPMQKPGITCTTRGQSNMIGTSLIARCQKELNLAPYILGKKLSETAWEFYPQLVSLQINPYEPIDP